MQPTISYSNGVSDVPRHESMDVQSSISEIIETCRVPELIEEQLDRTSSKDFSSYNKSVDDFVLEKEELIAWRVYLFYHLNFVLRRQVIRPKGKEKMNS